MVLFRVRPARGAVEHVVGRIMYQSCINLAAGHGEIAHGERVCVVGCHGLILGHVNLVVSRGIENNGGVHFSERALHTRAIADVHRRAVEACDRIPPLRKLTEQLNPELSTTPKDDNLMPVHLGVG